MRRLETRLKLLVLFLFLLIYLVESRLYLLSNFFYPDKFLEQDKNISPGWDKDLKNRLAKISQPKKAEEEKKKASEDKWINDHPPRAFLTIPEIRTSPLLDGRLDDEVWKDIPRTTPFTHYQLHSFSSVTTFTRVCYDSKNLYLGFSCAEPEMNKIKARVTRPDGEVWTDDSIEVFISPREEKREEYYHFILNTRETKYEAFKLDPSWNGFWKARVWRKDMGWEAEIAIPFSSLGIRGLKLGKILPINFNRSRYVQGTEYSNWSYTGGSFHKPETFGKIKLGIESPFLKEISWDSPFGDITLKTVLKNPLKHKASLELKVTSEKIKGPLKEEIFLNGGEEKELKIFFNQPDLVAAALQISLSEKGRDLLFYATPYLPLEPEKAFIRSWLICGPFPNPGGRKQGEAVEDVRQVKCKGFNEDFLISQGGELAIEPQEGMWQVLGGKLYRYKWQVKESPEAMIDFYKVLDPYEYIVVYAAGYVISEKPQEALIKLGSDDGYKLWVNHEFIAADHIHRGSSPDQNIHPLKLKKGKNIILLKIDQDFGGVNFYLRLTDLAGKPLTGIRSVLDPEAR